ncbi:MAG: RDD family protein [Deltaproteobacteria bacterium]|nr:RDD family protein [Deltaproteobacteria bacterium]
MSIAATMPTSNRGSSIPRGHADQVLRVRASGFGRRFLAATVDAIFLGAISMLVTFVTAMMLGVSLPHAKEIGPDLLVAGILDRNPMAVGALGLFAGLTILYELYGVGMAGQTLGMRLAGIRVIASRGRPPGAVRGLVRVLALPISVLPGGLGWLWALFDREHRALHDHLAGTYVILDSEA